MKRASMVVGLGVVVATSGAARADDPAPGGVVASYPLAIRDRPDTLPKGMLEIGGDTMVIGLSKDEAFKPVFLAPHVSYGITDNDTISLGFDAIPFGLDGLCLSGQSDGCLHFFNGIAARDDLELLPTGPVTIKAHAALQFGQSGGNVFLPVGVAFRLRLAPTVDVIVDPTLFFALANRDEGEREILAVPIAVRFQATERLNLFVDSTILSDVDPAGGSFGDSWNGSFGVGLTLALNRQIDVGAEFSFIEAYGTSSSADVRELMLRAAFRFGS